MLYADIVDGLDRLRTVETPGVLFTPQEQALINQVIALLSQNLVALDSMTDSEVLDRLEMLRADKRVIMSASPFELKQVDQMLARRQSGR